MDGLGWIVLAIVIFGAWNPVRVAFGAYLFGLLQWLSVVIQPNLQGIPSQVLQVAPFPLMILTLLLFNIGNAEWVERVLAALPEASRKRVSRILRSLRVVSAPQSGSAVRARLTPRLRRVAEFGHRYSGIGPNFGHMDRCSEQSALVS